MKLKRRWLKRGGWGLLGLAAAGFLVSASGIIPLKASAGHWPITRWFLQFSQKRSVATHSLGVDVPELADPALVLQGAGHYEFGCRSCHGAPGEPLPRIAQAMLPAPPALAPRIQEMEPRELFHVVKHGLKFTGMPAWPAQRRDDEVWAVVAFLLQLPQLDRAGYRRLVGDEPAPTTPIQTLDPAAAVPRAVLQTCARCHGVDGLGRGANAFPVLAGQRREYLEHALAAYAKGARHSGIMEPLVAGLDREVREELAAYYAGRPRRERREALMRDPELVEQGRVIATAGLPAQRVPACLECHHPSGHRAKPAYPSLFGQPARYLEQQLQLFHRGERGGSPYAHLMEEVASRLQPEQMRAVAEYFATLPSATNETP